MYIKAKMYLFLMKNKIQLNSFKKKDTNIYLISISK